MINDDSLKIAGYLKNLNPQQLQLAMKNPPPGVPLYLVMTEQLRRQNIERQAKAQPQGPQPTTSVADDLYQAGIASTPEMSMGGVDAPVGLGSLEGQPPQQPQQPPQGRVQNYASGGFVDSYDEYGGSSIMDAARDDDEEEGWLSRAGRAVGDFFGAAGKHLQPTEDDMWWKKPPPVSQTYPDETERGDKPDAPSMIPRDLYSPPPPAMPPRASTDNPAVDTMAAMPSRRMSMEAAAPVFAGSGPAPQAVGIQTLQSSEPPPVPQMPAFEQFVNMVAQQNPDILTKSVLERLEKRESALEQARDKAGPQALLATGLAIAMSNKRGLRGIAEGGLYGLQAYGKMNENLDKQQAEYDDIRIKLAEREQQRRMQNLQIANGMYNSRVNQDLARYNNEQENWRTKETLARSDRDYGAKRDDEVWNRRVESERLGLQRQQMSNAERRYDRQERRDIERETKQEERDRRAALSSYERTVQKAVDAYTKDPMLRKQDFGDFNVPMSTIESNVRKRVFDSLDGVDADYVAKSRKIGGSSSSTGSSTASMPRIGEVRNGYRFKGGNPNDRNNWESAR